MLNYQAKSLREKALYFANILHDIKIEIKRDVGTFFPFISFRIEQNIPEATGICLDFH